MTPVNPQEETADNSLLLRDLMHEGGIDIVLIPHADEYQNEFLAAYAERLAWLTGFTGSAGIAVVTANEVHLFVDGRYPEQARAEVNSDCVQVHLQSKLSHSQWLEDHLVAGQMLAVDPWLHTHQEIKTLESLCQSRRVKLSFSKNSLIDTVWEDQPEKPLATILRHPLEYSGESSIEKRRKITMNMQSKSQDAVVVSSPDSIAWLLNIRGGDVQLTPLPFSRVILHTSGHVDFFAHPQKITQDLKDFLEDCSIHAEEDFNEHLVRLGQTEKSVAIDSKTCPHAIYHTLKQAGANIVFDRDPCQLPKAIKNPIEIAGARQAHSHDGLALIRFLCWVSNIKPRDKVTEIDAAKALTEFRRQLPAFREISFPVISAYGSSGALPHYLPTKKSNRLIGGESLYLVDSGGQYLEGTTDITRVVPMGRPTYEMIRHYTLVLKGHITLATAQFPEGTTGVQLDCLARHALWQTGLDFNHGTGHGVGSYLGVHEGPQSISSHPVRGGEVLCPGMLITNEPGYYRIGHYGIRIENIMLVRKAVPILSGEQPMLCFETLTLVPFESKLIDVALLTQQERKWINTYHAKVYDTHASNLDKIQREWLLEITRPI